MNTNNQIHPDTLLAKRLVEENAELKRNLAAARAERDSVLSENHSLHEVNTRLQRELAEALAGGKRMRERLDGMRQRIRMTREQYPNRADVSALCNELDAALRPAPESKEDGNGK